MSRLREVEVVATGVVDRNDQCADCGQPMYYRVDDAGGVVASLCVNLLECGFAMVELPE